MNDEDLEALPEDLLRGLRKGRPGYDPPAETRSAVLSFVAAHAALAGAGLTGAAHAAGQAAASTGALGALKRSFGLGGLLLGAAVGAGGHAAYVAARHNAPSPEAPHEVSAPALVAPPLPTAPAPLESPPPTAPSATTTAAPAPPSRDASLAAERALLDMARTAVARGQGDVALGPLQRHAREFPQGRLAEEREWLWIQALVSTGQADLARDRAARFRKAFPHSLMIPALDRTVPAPSQ
jgi:hypothetical protein